MRKFISFILATVLVLGLISCGAEESAVVDKVSMDISSSDLVGTVWTYEDDANGEPITGYFVFVSEDTAEVSFILSIISTISQFKYSFEQNGNTAVVKLIPENDEENGEEWIFEKASNGELAAEYLCSGKKIQLTQTDVSSLESELAMCEADALYDFREGDKYVKAEGAKDGNSSKKKNSSSKNKFTNAYGTATTKCAISGCNSYIASSGDTNCCEKHSNRCLNCNAYIDSDAMYCMKCITESATRNSKK